MKWLITISRYIPEKIGGDIIYVRMFSEELSNLGDTVHIVTTTRRKGLKRIEKINNVTIHRIYVKKGNMGPLWFKYTQQVTNYINILDVAEKFDCLNIHGPFLVNTGILRRNIHVLYTLHAVVSYEHFFNLKKTILQIDSFRQIRKAVKLAALLPLHYFREWVGVNHATQIVVMSHYVKNTVRKFLPGIDLNKIMISKIGINENFTPASDKNALKEELGINGFIALLTVRRLEGRMGIENLITAMNKLKNKKILKPVKLFIAGEGSLKKKLERLVTKYDLKEHIEMLGFLRDGDLKKWYQASDVFIMPTEELEGFGISTIEAFASGIPVIATTAGANPEVAGQLCPELLTIRGNTPQGLSERIEFYINNKEKFNAVDYSLKSRKLFCWPDIIKELKAKLPVKIIAKT